MHHQHRPLVLLAAVLAFASPTEAQSVRPDHLLGGFIDAVWWEALPLTSGQPNGFAVWTAEDGSRIRRFDSWTGTWTEEIVFAPTPETLHDIYIDTRDPGVDEAFFGLAVGSNGQTLRWGHNSWSPVVTPPAPGKELWACAVDHRMNGTTIWVAGADQTLRCSQDLGINWNSVTFISQVKAGSAFTAMDFADWPLPQTRGIVGSNQGQLFWTSDGMTWTAGTIHATAATYVFWDIDFAPGSTSTAFAVGGLVEGNGPGFAFRTTDAGQNWYPVLTQYAATGFAPVPNTTVPPGNPCNGLPGLTGGTNTQTLYATLYGCHALANGSAFFVAYAGQVWRYLPAANYTIDVLDNNLFTRGPLWGCHGNGSNEVWLSGQFGIVRRSTDAGTSWTAMTPNRTWRLRDLAFPTSTIGYATGQSLRIAKTTDGGQSWVEQTAYHSGVNLGPTMQAIAAYDTQQLVAIGDRIDDVRPAVFRTNDGGATCWQDIDLRTTIPSAGRFVLNDVAAGALYATSGQPTFWICGQGRDTWSGLLRSTNGGASWSTFDIGLPATAHADYTWNGVSTVGNAVIMVGRNVVTNMCVARMTLDASATVPLWADVSPLNLPGTLRAVRINGAAAYAVGDGGKILNYDSAVGRFVIAAGSAGMTSKELHQIDMGFDGTVLWVYAAGENGTLLRSVHQSNAWEQVFSSTTDRLLGLAVRTSAMEHQVWYTGRNGRWGDSTILVRR